MQELDTLKQTVLEKAAHNGEEKYSDIHKENQQILEKFENSQEIKLANKKTTYSQKAQSQFNVNQQRYRNLKRNDILALQERLMSEILTEVRQGLEKLDESYFSSFVEQAIIQINTDQPFVIQFGERSQAIGQSILFSELAEKYPHMTLAREVYLGEGGFKVIQQGLEINYLFNDLLDELKPTLKAQISSQLFQ